MGVNNSIGDAVNNLHDQSLFIVKPMKHVYCPLECTTSMYINMCTYCKLALFAYSNKDTYKYKQVLSSHKVRYTSWCRQEKVSNRQTLATHIRQTQKGSLNKA